MQLPPEQAQAMFVDEIAHELNAKAELAMCSDEPGRVSFNDGVVDIDTLPIARSDDTELYTGLRELTGHHLHVDFSADGAGTKVRMHGHVEHDVCGALERFGQPGEWPETGFVHG